MKNKLLAMLVATFASVSGFAQPTKPSGIVGWFDINTTQPSRAKEFYGALLGWEFQEIFPGYFMILNNGTGIGGLRLAESADRGTQGTRLYFTVSSLRDSYALALKIGASGSMEPTDISGFGSYAIIQDLDKNEVALFSDKPLSTKSR